MKKFDVNYKILADMYRDTSFPTECVDKVKELIDTIILYLETGETNIKKVQKQLDNMTIGINDLQDFFEKNESEIETGARESIGETLEYILQWFNIDIDCEDAIAQRDW